MNNEIATTQSDKLFIWCQATPNGTIAMNLYEMYIENKKI